MDAPERLETVAVCVDGSEISTRAVASGIALLRPAARLAVVTVIEDIDLSLVTGTGFAGGVMSEAELDQMTKAAESDAREVVERAARELDLPRAELHVLRGAPGPALCSFARDISARALVMGSRGRGGVKRALLGSVSDHVVRNAPCPVVVVGPEA